MQVSKVRWRNSCNICTTPSSYERHNFGGFIFSSVVISLGLSGAKDAAPDASCEYDVHIRTLNSVCTIFYSSKNPIFVLRRIIRKQYEQLKRCFFRKVAGAFFALSTSYFCNVHCATTISTTLEPVVVNAGSKNCMDPKLSLSSFCAIAYFCTYIQQCKDPTLQDFLNEQTKSQLLT